MKRNIIFVSYILFALGREKKKELLLKWQ